MRNLIMESLDVKYSHHRCEYCSNTDWYWCYNLQYLRDLKEIKYLILSIKKDRIPSAKVVRSLLIK